MSPSESGGRTAFLTGFSVDVFLSYAHVDNLPDRPDSETQGWIDRFEARLDFAIWKRLGERVKIWRDRSDLKKSDKISDSISSAVENAALYLILISNRYLKSDSCRNEIEWIEKNLRSVTKHLTAGARVYPVLLYNIPESKRPAPCMGAVGYAFHDSVDPEDPGVPLDPERKVDAFTTALDELVNDLVERLRDIKASVPGAVSEPPLVSRYRVFLTATPGTRLLQKKRLQEALRKESFEFPGESIPPPYEAGRHEEAIRRVLNNVDLSVHLIDEQPGPFVEGKTDGCFPEEQCRVAYGSGKQQLVILPEFCDLDAIEVPSHRKLIEQLLRGEWPGGATANRLTVAKARQDEAILELIRREREETARTLAAGKTAAGKSVFIDLHTRDLASVAPLFEFLESQNLEPITIPSSQLTPGEYRASFVEIMARSAALIIVYGQVGLEWVKARAQSAYQMIIAKELRYRPIVYAAPPAKSLTGLEYLHCPIVDCTGGFNKIGMAAAMWEGA